MKAAGLSDGDEELTCVGYVGPEEVCVSQGDSDSVGYDEGYREEKRRYLDRDDHRDGVTCPSLPRSDTGDC